MFHSRGASREEALKRHIYEHEHKDVPGRITERTVVSRSLFLQALLLRVPENLLYPWRRQWDGICRICGSKDILG